MYPTTPTMTKKRTPFRPPQNKSPAAASATKPLPRRQRGQGVAEEPAPEARRDAPRGRGMPENDYPQDFGADEQGDTGLSAKSAPVEPSEKLHKVLAQAGLGSRRDMEVAIEAGRISVNGRVAEVGARVTPIDRILIDGRPVRKANPDERPRILIYHKPEGEIVSRDDPQERESVFDKLPRVRGGKWVSIGRLDYNTSGLLIFSTSGELANKLSHPSFEVEREYAVRVMGELTIEQCRELINGIELDDGPAKFEWLRDEGGDGANHWYRVMLREGRNREVRRMFETMNVMVSRLMRVRYGIINLPPRLKRGSTLELDDKQAKSVLTWAGMAVATSPAPPAKTARGKPPTRREAGDTSRDYARQPARRRTGR